MTLPPATDALRCWRAWDATGLRAAAAAAPPPEQAWWLALAALICEQADVLAHLDAAHAGHAAQGDGARAAVVAHAALVVCLLDTGAMERVRDWQARAAERAAPEPADDLGGFWLRLGHLARVALGEPDTPAAGLAAAWLHAQLRPLRPVRTQLSPDERLMAAQVLVDYHFGLQRFEQFDFLANLVEAPATFDAASPLMRARWLYTAGYAHYQVGAHDAARDAWQRALAIARDAALHSQQLLATLALARLLIDRVQLDEAEALVDAVRPQWGAGRTAQLIELKQLRARLQLLRGQPVPAFATLQDTLRLADAAGLSASERASCHTDLAQVLVALDRVAEAAALLQRLAAEHGGRDAQVFACLHRLLCAQQACDDAPAAAAHLQAALALAQQARYTMFFRLLPLLAAQLCALALRCGVERAFVLEVIRSRALPAPADADERWPWAVWLQLLGGSLLQVDGTPPPAGGKTAHKPLELLRLLACERGLTLGVAAVQQSLWPDGDGDRDGDLRKRLEMTVQRLRRLLGDATLVWVCDGRVGLDVTRVASDVSLRRGLVERIEALAMHGAIVQEQVEAQVAALTERVLALTRGELLPAAPEAAWLLAARRRCRADTVRAALSASAVLGRQQAGAAERGLLQAALRIEPLAESLACRLMQAHNAAGQRGDALRAFEGAAPGAGRARRRARRGSAGAVARPDVGVTASPAGSY